MINVLNKYKLEGNEENIVYIGRPSCLGNPYSHLKGTLAEFHVDTRDDAVSKYEDWLLEKLNVDKNPVVRKEMNKILNMAKVGDVNLVCWCKPQSCHGDVIKKLIERRLVQEIKQ